jgi:glycogen(starch) synthase
MRVLMFGWEFPPHISGGLGTACYGITNGLLNNAIEVLFVVPHLFGDEEGEKFKFIDASEMGFDTFRKGNMEIFKLLKFIQVSSSILPYLSPDSVLQSNSVEHNNNPFVYLDNTSFLPFNFSNHYGKDLMKEVVQYALIASNIAEQNTFDVIHAHDWLTYPAGIVAKQISGKPLIVHVHATEFDRSAGHINKDVYDIELKGMQAADKIITVSEYTARILLEHYQIDQEKIKVIHNGVNCQKDNSSIGDQSINKNRIVTFLGRVTHQKGPDYYVEAAKKVLQKFPDTHFVLAGSGDMLNKMIKRVAELRMSSRFSFTGFLKGDEINRLFEMTDVYVMPSVSEPFGISPLEAANKGVPVVISKQSGVSEVLKNALKIDFWDIDALADSICGLLKYKTLSTKFSREAKKEVEKLNWDQVGLKIKHIYQSLII